MKLSDVKGERVFDVFAQCISPVANIAADPEASRLFRREKLPPGADKNAFIKEKIISSVPPLLTVHKKDIVAVLSSIEGVSPKEYEQNLTMAKLMADIIDLLTDDAFMGLFISAQRKTDSNSSGSAQENTQAQNTH